GPDGRAQGAGPARTVAVVGPNADDPHAQLGDWAGASGQVNWMPDGHPRELVSTVLDGLRARVPSSWTVTHAPGARIGTLVPDPEGPLYPDGQPRPPVFAPAADDPRLRAQAVEAARAADWVVAVLGDDVSLTGEGRSTATLDLQGGQIALLDALVETGTPVVLVLVQGKPSTLPPSAERVAAIVQAFNPGMAGGQAVAEVLLGLVEPSGRLPITVPRHVGQLPVFYNQVRGQHGSRYADLTQDPLFAFGEGMGYAPVTYSDLQVVEPVLGVDGTVRARVQVHNLGDRPVRETVQVYVSDTVTSVTWADRELKAFMQVEVPAGQTVEVAVEVPVAACTLVDTAGHRVVEPGTLELLVGHSSRPADLLRASFEVRP
ncbi:MAG: glycoside hydrolase family 3 C-terminal domain-containing protein, partial [Actinobacteria bacterium]|nr:glycoside hydrolase family 3 C-terminal domain-containing protein [Actinomycetota bacterium]